MEPKTAVDIILPTYNRAQWLESSMGSVLGQSFQDWVLWVVDDGSTDETPSLLKAWCDKDSRIRSLRTKNMGVSAARNTGLRASRNPWVAFLDSDDQWDAKKLETQMNFAREHSDYPLIHCDEIWVRNGVRVNPMKKHQKQGGDIFERCLELCCISPSAAILRRDLIELVGFFREDFEVCEDYDLWLRVCSRYSVGYVDLPLVTKNGGHEDQLSRKLHSMDFFRITSMAALLSEVPLAAAQKKLVHQQIQKKGNVLLKGCRKHQNLHFYDDVFCVLQATTGL